MYGQSFPSKSANSMFILLLLLACTICKASLVMCSGTYGARLFNHYIQLFSIQIHNSRCDFQGISLVFTFLFLFIYSHPTAAVSLFPPNLSTKYVEAVVQVCSRWAWVLHQRAAWPVKVYTKLCSRPCSPIFLDTSYTWMAGDPLSLNLSRGITVDSSFVGIRLGYFIILPSYTTGIALIEKQLLMLSLGMASMLQHYLALDS